jgi:hypothetical protein
VTYGFSFKRIFKIWDYGANPRIGKEPLLGFKCHGLEGKVSPITRKTWEERMPISRLCSSFVVASLFHKQPMALKLHVIESVRVTAACWKFCSHQTLVTESQLKWILYMLWTRWSDRNGSVFLVLRFRRSHFCFFRKFKITIFNFL